MVTKRPNEPFDICRLCLQFSGQLIHIFDDHVPYSSEKISLSSKIMDCVSIKILPTDRGPRKICNNCRDSIDSWYKFKENCKTVNEYVQKHFNDVDDQNELLPKVDDLTSVVCENSLNDFSLSSFDSAFGKHLNFKTNLSSILDVYFNDETPQVDYEKDKVSDIDNTEVIDTNGDVAITEPLVADLQIPELVAEEPPKKRRKGYTCELCSETFARFITLLNHDDNVHQNVFREHSCRTCGRLFISANRLQVHELSHREKTHKCVICDKLFSSAKSLEVHSRLHSGKYKCTTCGFVSTSKSYLEEHLLKHVGGETTHLCKVCSMSFKLRSSLLRHENTHRKHGGKHFKCPICGLVTSRRCELREHMAVHDSEDATKFKCALCSKSYRSKRTLRAHLMRHNEARFQCKICNRKFHSKYELRDHEETHGHDKLYPCFHCEKKFSFRSTLLKHLKKTVPRVRSDIAVI